jgi:hypothetical protein
VIVVPVCNDACVVLDEEVKVPIAIDARLPEAPALVVRLAAERGVVEVRFRCSKCGVRKSFITPGA